MLTNCPKLDDVLSSLDDGSDFFKIFFARNQFDKQEIITSLEEIFERITKLQQAQPLSLLLDW